MRRKNTYIGIFRRHTTPQGLEVYYVVEQDYWNALGQKTRDYIDKKIRTINRTIENNNDPSDDDLKIVRRTFGDPRSMENFFKQTLNADDHVILHAHGHNMDDDAQNEKGISLDRQYRWDAPEIAGLLDSLKVAKTVTLSVCSVSEETASMLWIQKGVGREALYHSPKYHERNIRVTNFGLDPKWPQDGVGLPVYTYDPTKEKGMPFTDLDSDPNHWTQNFHVQKAFEASEYEYDPNNPLKHVEVPEVEEDIDDGIDDLTRAPISRPSILTERDVRRINRRFFRRFPDRRGRRPRRTGR